MARLSRRHCNQIRQLREIESIKMTELGTPPDLPDIPVDERGIPITPEDAVSSAHAPTKPCQLCVGTATNGQKSWEWCCKHDVCAATIDWEKVFHRD